jgi:cobalt-zinc-cadmium efflux system protein
MRNTNAHSSERAQVTRENSRRLRIALILTILYMIFEILGGFFFNSLALIADAGHMLTDSAALALTLFAFWFSTRPATATKTYGYYRLEILAAFINGVALVLISLFIFYEAYNRWQNPPPVEGLGLTIVAGGGLIVNLVSVWLLHNNHAHNLNMRSALLHVISDALGSVAAIIAGLSILLFQWFWMDAFCSALIAAIIIYSAWNLIKESVNILLEGAPSHINLAAVENSILATNGVISVHDLHVWTIASQLEALSAHVQYEQSIQQSELLRTLRKRLHDEFGIDHLTIQMETSEFEDEDIHFCDVGIQCFQRESLQAGGKN